MERNITVIHDPEIMLFTLVFSYGSFYEYFFTNIRNTLSMKYYALAFKI